MPRILVTASVNNATEWEAGFRTHGELFRRQGVSNIDFATTADNKVSIVFHVDNYDEYMKWMEHEDTADAMHHDGVQRDTVKIQLLDREFTP